MTLLIFPAGSEFDSCEIAQLWVHVCVVLRFGKGGSEASPNQDRRLLKKDKGRDCEHFANPEIRSE